MPSWTTPQNRISISPIIAQRAPSDATVRSPWPIHILVLLILTVVAALRIWFLCSTTEISLASDEAHYWDWSRHLDWCYYSKGPLVAWLIRASCWVWGADVMPAVRLPAVICNFLTVLGIYILVYRIFRSAPLGLVAVLAAHTLPFLHVGGLLMTIDAPYTCAWTWAVLVSHIILFSDEKKSILWWCLLGLIVAVGVLAKHNMALFVPSLGLFLLLSPEHRKELLRPGFWVMSCIGGILGGGPILWWNAQHNWVTFLHVGTQAAGQGESSLRWIGPLEFVGTQAGIMMGFWFVLMIIGFVQVLRGYWKGSFHAQQMFLVCLALPMLLICLVFSFKVRIEPNWPITAYITGLILAGWILWDRWQIKAWRRTAIGFAIAGLLLSILIHGADVLYPVHAHFFPNVSPRKWDATCRLKGWTTLAARVEELRREQSASTMLLGSNWSYTGALAFHLPDQPTVYCLGPVTGSRQSQYDFWRPNPLHDPEKFVGQDAIIVGDISPEVKAAFEKLEPTQLVQAKQRGLIIAEWNVTVARKLKPTGFGEKWQEHIRH